MEGVACQPRYQQRWRLFSDSSARHVVAGGPPRRLRSKLQWRRWSSGTSTTARAQPGAGEGPGGRIARARRGGQSAVPATVLRAMQEAEASLVGYAKART